MNFENFADLLKLNKDRGPLEFERFISIAENNNNNKKKIIEMWMLKELKKNPMTYCLY